MNCKTFLLVTTAISSRLTGSVSKVIFPQGATYDMTHLEDKNIIHLSLAVPKFKTRIFYHCHIQLMGGKVFIDCRNYRYDADIQKQAVLSIFKCIANRQEESLIFNVGLIDENSVLRYLTQKILDTTTHPSCNKLNSIFE